MLERNVNFNHLKPKNDAEKRMFRECSERRYSNGELIKVPRHCPLVLVKEG
jgi:hypothetical protein